MTSFAPAGPEKWPPPDSPVLRGYGRTNAEKVERRPPRRRRWPAWSEALAAPDRRSRRRRRRRARHLGPFSPPRAVPSGGRFVPALAFRASPALPPDRGHDLLQVAPACVAGSRSPTAASLASFALTAGHERRRTGPGPARSCSGNHGTRQRRPGSAPALRSRDRFRSAHPGRP